MQSPSLPDLTGGDLDDLMMPHDLLFGPEEDLQLPRAAFPAQPVPEGAVKVSISVQVDEDMLREARNSEVQSALSAPQQQQPPLLVPTPACPKAAAAALGALDKGNCPLPLDDEDLKHLLEIFGDWEDPTERYAMPLHPQDHAQQRRHVPLDISDMLALMPCE